jgi:hypothetical protein
MDKHESEDLGTGNPQRVIAEGDAETIRRDSARRTRRRFLVGGVATAAAAGAVYWIDNTAPVGRLQGALRHTLGFDADVDRTVFDFRGLAPEFPLAHARPLRLNGVVGLDQVLEPASYRLLVAGVANAAASPRFVRDVTAWNYSYGDDTSPAQAPPDNKTAPGPKPEARSGDQPKAQQSVGEGSAKTPEGGAPGADGLSKNGIPAPAQGGADLKNAPKVNGIPHISIEERFNQMAIQVSGKRHQGSDEAGPSANSLNIGTPGLLLTLDDLKKLPHVELVTEFKCIEGWSSVTHWGGVRLRDFLDAYPPAKVNGREPRFVYMETPDGNYYCGYDMGAARHPQSLLVMEMDGVPLTQVHGAPLRLHMPIKYGYKQIKRIGLIAYTDQKPDDYWTKLGYDWYAGL